MKLDPVGEVENPQDLDLGPIEVPIVGYKPGPKGNVRVETIIRFKKKVPFKFFQEAIENGIDLAALKPNDQLQYLTVSVEEEDKAKFLELIFGDEVFVDRSTLREVFKKVDEARVSPRPTKQPSDSSTSIKPTKRTTGRAANSTDSRSKRSA